MPEQPNISGASRQGSQPVAVERSRIRHPISSYSREDLERELSIAWADRDQFAKGQNRAEALLADEREALLEAREARLNRDEAAALLRASDVAALAATPDMPVMTGRAKLRSSLGSPEEADRG